jgi:hypothetical protein
MRVDQQKNQRLCCGSWKCEVKIQLHFNECLRVLAGTVHYGDLPMQARGTHVLVHDILPSPNETTPHSGAPAVLIKCDLTTSV